MPDRPHSPAGTDWPPDPMLAVTVQRGRVQQGLIDAEMRASRRAILSAFRLRLRSDADTLGADDFLALADETIVHAAVMVAAQSVAGADACQLRVRDPVSDAMRLVRHRGLPPSLLDHPPGEPAVIDDIGDAAFAGLAIRGPMLDAGFRAMHCHPLHDGEGRVLGLLTLYYRGPGRRHSEARLVAGVGKALAHVADMRAHAPMSVESVADRTTVTVRDALDAGTAALFTGLVRRTLAGLGPPHTVVVDLRGLEVLAAAGVRAVFAVHEQCQVRGIECYLIAGPCVRAVLARLAVPSTLRVVEEGSHPAQATPAYRRWSNAGAIAAWPR
ncbi:STAS domain-containing protein [Actinoplanes sp. NPDC023714]|uniref:STAS domain-containing protein n=1 Tax=Actinoplanes sp. NPDC023714 TaxID=3154322 RepID=UPI0033C8FBF9